jgi:salicylate hydroxylase
MVFLNRVAELGIPLHMGTEVMEFNENKPSIFLKGGSEIEADIIIGADGIKSKTRELVLGFKDAPKSSGYACYRAFFPGDWLKDDPLCKHFVEKDMLNVYIGEDMHVVQNTLQDGKEVFSTFDGIDISSTGL